MQKTRSPDTAQPYAAFIVRDHGITPEQIHRKVHAICQTLARHGHTALLVGGAVRDLLLGRFPKDFDLSTSARPEQVRRLFRNSRIIGRRFRLVQVRDPELSVEISTFRAEPGRKKNGMIWRDNRYGSLEEDVYRRDFTINALTLDPADMTLIDFVGAMADLRTGRLRTIKPPRESYREDPVRMLRAVRFKCRLGLSLDADCERAIPPQAKLLHQASRHRLADELQRFLASGQAEQTFGELHGLGLLKPLLHMEHFPWYFSPGVRRDPLAVLGLFLQRMDQWAKNGAEPMPPTVILLGLLVALGPEWMREYVCPENARTPPRTRERAHPRLRGLLAEWGFLNGQVTPALAILKAGRFLARLDRERAGDPAGYVSVTGCREGWLLLASLEGLLTFPRNFIMTGLKQLAFLPDLPILDHPRPLRGQRLAGQHPPQRRGRRRRKPYQRRH